MIDQVRAGATCTFADGVIPHVDLNRLIWISEGQGQHWWRVIQRDGQGKILHLETVEAIRQEQTVVVSPIPDQDLLLANGRMVTQDGTDALSSGIRDIKGEMHGFQDPVMDRGILRRAIPIGGEQGRSTIEIA